MGLFGKGKGTVLRDGLEAQARIVSLREGGPYVNDEPTYTLELHVQVPDRPVYTATARGRLPRLVVSRLAPEAVIPVRVDPQDASKVVVDEHAMLGTTAADTGYRIKPKDGAITMADVIERGVPARVRLRKVRDLGMRSPDGRDAVILLTVDVELPGEKPFKTRVAQRTPPDAVERLVEGAEFPGRVLPENHKHVVLDWLAAGLATPAWIAGEPDAPPPPVVAPQESAADPAERLRRLGELREAGLLTEAEFAAKKAEILADR